MKGISGIIVAIALGVAGALFNLMYLHNEALKADTISFIGVKKGAIIGRGERLSEDNLVKVDIPKNRAGNLVDYAFLWSELVGVKNEPVWRALDSTQDAVLLLRSDLKTPHKELELGKGERAVFVALPRNVVTAHINPGDKVSFKFWNAPLAPTPAPTRIPLPARMAGKDGIPAAVASEAAPKPEAADPPAAASEPGEVIGPFVVLSVGNRLDSVDVMKSAKLSPSQENTLVIRVSKNVAGEEDRYNKLGQRLHSAGSNSYDIILDGK